MVKVFRKTTRPSSSHTRLNLKLHALGLDEFPWVKNYMLTLFTAFRFFLRLLIKGTEQGSTLLSIALIQGSQWQQANNELVLEVQVRVGFSLGIFFS